MQFLGDNVNALRSQALLFKLESGHSKDFWKESRSLKLKTESLPVSVAEIAGEPQIVRRNYISIYC